MQLCVARPAYCPVLAYKRPGQSAPCDTTVSIHLYGTALLSYCYHDQTNHSFGTQDKIRISVKFELTYDKNGILPVWYYPRTNVSIKTWSPTYSHMFHTSARYNAPCKIQTSTEWMWTIVVTAHHPPAIGMPVFFALATK